MSDETGALTDALTEIDRLRAALAEAEQKGAREALLAAADAVWIETLSRGRADLRDWLRARAAQIGEQ